MSNVSHSRCPRCGTTLRADESFCPGCILAASTGDSSQSEERVFQQALALEPEARLRFIREATREDSRLYSAVLLLLEGYEEAGGDAAQSTQADAPNNRAQWAMAGNEEPGTVFNHFRLIRRLGEGGMGSVWRAEQTEPVRRTVALKIIKLGMDTREVVKRFERERQTLASLNHPNIAQVFEAGATVSGRPYFAMELVEGESITAYCKHAGLNVEARLHLIQEVCAAVEHAHQKGIIHRDLKPSNILVANGVVKVIDFGVAKATQSTADMFFTQHSKIIGTPAYMSPEQAQTGGVDVDTRTDVYALGVVLYELLTGTLPIESSRLANTSLREMQRILLEEDPPTPSTRMASLAHEGGNHDEPIRRHIGLSRDLDRVVMKAIRKERNERYASAAALAEDLRRYLENEPVSAVPPTLVYQIRKFVRRHRVAVVSAAAVLIALTAASIVSITMAIQAGRAASLEKAARQETTKTLARMYTQLALDHRHEGDPAQAALWAAKAAELSVDDPDKYEASQKRAAMWTEEVPVPLRAFKSDFKEIRKLIFHPGERFLIAEERDGNRQLWDLDHEKKISFGGVDLFAAAVWNPEGGLLASVQSLTNEITLRQFPTGNIAQPSLRNRADDSAIDSLAFNCNGTLLAAGGGKSVAIFRRGDDGVFSFLLSIPQTNTVQRIVFSPTDPNCVATALTNDLAGLFSIDAIKPAYIIHFAARQHHLNQRRIDSAEPPRFDKAGDILTLSVKGTQNRYGMATYKTSTGVQIAEFNVLPGFILAESPDGDVAICRHEVENPWNIASVIDTETGQDLSTITFHRTVTVADFSADGQRAIVASEDGQVSVLAAPDWKQEFQLSLHQLQVMGVAFSPSGQFAATAQVGSVVRIWRLQHRHRSFVTLGHDTEVTLSHDGTFFASTGRTAPDATLSFARVYRTSDGQPAGPVLPIGQSVSSELLPDSTQGIGLVMTAAFSPAGDVLAVGNSGPGIPRNSLATNGVAVTFWDWRTGTRLGKPVPMPSEPRSLAWRPDGREIAVTCGGGEFVMIDPTTRLARLYQQETKRAAQFPVNNGRIAYNATGDILAAWGLQRGVHLWSVSDGQQHLQQAGTSVGISADVAFAQDGMFAWAETGTRANRSPSVFILEAATGKQIIKPLAQPEWMNSVAFNEKGNLLLTTARDGLTRIWDWRDRRLHCPPIQQRGSVYTGCFVPGTPYAVTGGDHGLFTIMDTRTGIEIASFAVSSDSSQILEIQMTPDGRTAVFGGKGLDGVGIVRLSLLHDPSHLGLKGLLMLTTLNAGVNVDREGVQNPMTTEEWLTLWKEFRQEFPDYHAL